MTRSNFSRASGCGAITSMRSATEKPGNVRPATERPRGPWRRGLRRCARTPHRGRRCRRWRSRSSRRRAHNRRRRAVAVMRDVGDVGAGLLLGQREGGDGVAAARALEPVALLGVAEQADRPGAEALHGEGEIGEPVVARQRLADQAERAHVERLPARRDRARYARASRRGRALAPDRGRRHRRRHDRPADWPRTSARSPPASARWRSVKNGQLRKALVRH